MSDYRDDARSLILSRKSDKKQKQLVSIPKARSLFIDMAMSSEFKNVLDLLIEWYGMNIDSSDKELVLEELLKQEDVYITTVYSAASYLKKLFHYDLIYTNQVVIFNNVFGMNIYFIVLSKKEKDYECVVQKGDITPSSRDIKLTRELLTCYVADFLEKTQ